MEQDAGVGLLIWSVAEVVNVAVGAPAADHGGTWRGINGLALGADGDLAVVADADAGLLAPDVGPPRAVGIGTDDRAFFGAGLWLGLERGLAGFAVDFMLVGVGHELVEPVVGPDQFENALGGQQGHEAFLPVVVAAFDFAFGLGRWRLEPVMHFLRELSVQGKYISALRLGWRMYEKHIRVISAMRNGSSALRT
jgi:hypothetical protein